MCWTGKIISTATFGLSPLNLIKQCRWTRRKLKDTLYSMKHFMRQLSLWSTKQSALASFPFFCPEIHRKCASWALSGLFHSNFFMLPELYTTRRKPRCSFTQYWIQFCYCPSSSLDGFRVKRVLKWTKILCAKQRLRFVLGRIFWNISGGGCKAQHNG